MRAKISKAVRHYICLSTNPTKAARIKIKNKARNISYKSVDFPRGLNRETQDGINANFCVSFHNNVQEVLSASSTAQERAAASAMQGSTNGTFLD